MRQSLSFSLLAALFLSVSLSGCLGNDLPPADNRIRLVDGEDGLVAIPPECASWREAGWGDPWSNETWPSYGCATANNLAAQVENPADLLEARDVSVETDGVVVSGTIARYQAGQTTPLIDIGQSVKDTRRSEDPRIGGAPRK